MEPGVIAVIILIMVAGGAALLLSRQRTIPWSLPALRPSGWPAFGTASERLEPERPLSAGAETNGPAPVAMLAPARPVPEAADVPRTAQEPDEPARLPEPIRLDIAPSAASRLHDRLDQIEAQLDELHAVFERRDAALSRALSEMQRSIEADEARDEAALERLRADLMTAIAQRTVEPPNRGIERRVEISADLYARLARFESALSAVTNPVLLPGEAYAAPAELLTEALVWENWNEVGERAFALADAYSAQRLYLSEQARADVGDFITTLRLLLTRSIYPNLHEDLSAEQQNALRNALNEIATELAKVRVALDREYQDACEA